MPALHTTAKRPPAPPLMPARAAPRIADLVVDICHECLRAYAKKRCDQLYCTAANCRRKANARLEARRTEAYRALMAFRTKKKGTFAAMTNIADRWAREDKQREDAYRVAYVERGVEE